MRRLLLCLLLGLAALSSPLQGAEAARLIPLEDGCEQTAESEAVLAGRLPGRATEVPAASEEREAPLSADRDRTSPPPAAPPPGPVPIRLLIRRFNE